MNDNNNSALSTASQGADCLSCARASVLGKGGVWAHTAGLHWADIGQVRKEGRGGRTPCTLCCETERSEVH